MEGVEEMSGVKVWRFFSVEQFSSDLHYLEFFTGVRNCAA